MTTSLNDLKSKRDHIMALAARYHAYNVRIFGSFARNEANSHSDVDFLVSFSSEASLFDQAGLIESLSLLLKRKVDVVSERAISPYLKTAITKDAMPL